MPENAPPDQPAAPGGAMSYIAAGEWGELFWRALGRLGFVAPPAPIIRSAGRMAQRPALHLVALTHTLAREGASICLLDVLRGLAAQGLKLTLVAPKEGPLAAEAKAAGIGVVLAPAPQHRARGSQGYEAGLTRFAAGLADLAPGVVLANTLASFHGLDAARLVGVPSLLAVHEGEPPTKFFAPWPRAVQARAFGAMTYPREIIFVSRSSADRWPDKAIPKSVIRNAPDPALFTALTAKWRRADARATLGVESDAFVFLSMGTICRRKGQEDIARAASALAPAQILCVGPIGPDGAAIAASLRACANVVLPGATDDAARFYAAADAFLLTSRIENYPRVIQEAQAFGLPLIATPVNGVPEQAGEGEALFYQPGDIGGLIAAGKQFVQDVALRERLAHASRRRAAAFESYPAMIEAYAGAVTRAYNSAEPSI